MGRALALAERARGLTSPNPMVGAVVAHGETIVGEGFHAAAGQPHAEIEALRAAGGRARGATLYLTLEPCVHRGRTPPCAPAVVAAAPARVVVAALDPNPVVAGRGVAALTASGIEVAVGVLGPEAARQNRTFFTAMREGRPHVTMKAAMTLDGRIADAHGDSQWITGEPARRVAHRLRREADAILVGVGTALRDDPQLTVRGDEPWPREPYRVVVDSMARTPVSARLIAAGTAARVIIAVGDAAPVERVERLEEAGVLVVRHHRVADGRVDLRSVLADLHRREVRAVLVEGGAEIHGSLLEAGLVDRVAVFIAPRLLGGRAAVPAVAGGGFTLKDAVRLGPFEIIRVGDDVLLEADVIATSRP
jgi:diaminohydroxyphosphoribosylaminopyrimidine deaminase/5-amino-6-(5-phosphoribosylamino)uracil reductase